MAIKLGDIPPQAWAAEPTPMPMRWVRDIVALYEQLERDTFVVLRCPVNELRVTNIGAEEAPDVKALTAYAYQQRKVRVHIRRLDLERWVVCIANPKLKLKGDEQ